MACMYDQSMTWILPLRTKFDVLQMFCCPSVFKAANPVMFELDVDSDVCLILTTNGVQFQLYILSQSHSPR